jgi:hypothetical protein
MKPSMTSSCCPCHHAARTWPRWPPGPSNEAYLSSPHREASPATTFRACSSPAPTLVKPQPAPPILSQESVHTTLSITHHTRKQPSTGPRTTHGPQLRVFVLYFPGMYRMSNSNYVGIVPINLLHCLCIAFLALCWSISRSVGLLLAKEMT